MTQWELDGPLQTMWVGSFASGLGSCVNCIKSSDFINSNTQHNLLSLNLTTTHYLKFKTKHHSNVNAGIRFDSKLVTKATETKSLGVIIDDTLS
jgi:hypothetical protein